MQTRSDRTISFNFISPIAQQDLTTLFVEIDPHLINIEDMPFTEPWKKKYFREKQQKYFESQPCIK